VSFLKQELKLLGVAVKFQCDTISPLVSQKREKQVLETVFVTKCTLGRTSELKRTYTAGKFGLEILGFSRTNELIRDLTWIKIKDWSCVSDLWKQSWPAHQEEASSMPCTQSHRKVLVET
jgi:hypothetical protein